MAPGEPRRAGLRQALASEYAARVARGLAKHKRRAAYRALLELARLWHPGDLKRSGERASLARHAKTARAVRSAFARSGGDKEAAAALALLIEMDPRNADRYKKEIDEIFAFGDDLAVARYGDGAQRARPIKILESVVDAFPSSYVLARLTTLYVARQRAIDRHFKRRGANFPLIRAHGSSVLRTTWNIVRIHARARRLGEAPGAIETVHGLGDDPSLRRTLRLALSTSGSARSWLTLARAMRGDEAKHTDLTASLAIATEGITRFPGDAKLRSYAADTARSLNFTPLAVRLYRDLAKKQLDTRSDAQSLAEIYDAQMGALLFRERPRAALQLLATIERLHAYATKRWPQSPLDPDLADAYATFGRGLVGLGELDEARRYLDRSNALRPNQSALEFLATISLKQDRYRDAARLFDKALAVTGTDLSYRFNRAKILRLAAEAYKHSGDSKRHGMYSRAALSAWGDLTSEHSRLPARYRSELFVESGKIMWGIGDKRAALMAFNTAIDADPNGADAHAAVVSFLVGRDHYARALDTYHRALGSQGISVYFKVYMSLWIVAEARRAGHEIDPLATEYLAGRNGRLWYDDLARYASGRTSRDTLVRRATTRARRAEMLYYTAVLRKSPDPKAMRKQLEAVIHTNAVMFFEYDMAKRWLGRLPKPDRAR
jgi:tetratricopeptide (TPR) repeat protein